MASYVHNRTLADALMKRGLIPAGCRVLDLRVEVDSVVVIRYEKLVSSEELSAFADAMKDVAEGGK